MKITRNSTPTNRGASETFTGAVYLDAVARPSEGWPVNVSYVRFTPGARTAWHRHPRGQTLYVTEGIGRVQRRGGPVETIAPGDRVFVDAAEEHWHGAAPDRFMTHISMVVTDENGHTAIWGEHVTDEEYNAGQ